MEGCPPPLVFLTWISYITYWRKHTKVETIPTNALAVKNSKTEKKSRCTDIIE